MVDTIITQEEFRNILAALLPGTRQAMKHDFLAALKDLEEDLTRASSLLAPRSREVQETTATSGPRSNANLWSEKKALEFAVQEINVVEQEWAEMKS